MSDINGQEPPGEPAARRGRGGRASRRARDAGAPRSISQPPWRQPRLPFPPMELLSADQIEAIHEASLQVLEEIGVDFMLPEARAVLKQAGADVDPSSQRVRFDRALVEAKIGTAPERFTLHARNPAHDLEMGGNAVIFSAIASPPNASDMDHGRRTGNTDDFRNFLRLAQYFNIIHMTGGYPVEPVDRHASIRHLECLRDIVTFTDKVGHAYSLGPERIRDGMEIYRIARGVSPERFAQEPSVMSIINSSSPLRLDGPMLGGIMEMSARGQPVCLTPFTLAGAMAPVTLSGAIVEQNAEALAGLVFTQAVNPGAPFIYGAFTSNVDMRSGAPAFGTPEYMKSAIIGGQMARRYRLPYRTSNTNAANTVDAQAAYETVFSLWGAIMGGGNFVKHAAGWMEGGLVASFEKFVLDVDLLQMVAEFLKPVEVDPDSLALDAMREVGPGGHFFGAMHTQARYRTAFYAPLISDWRNHLAWVEAGSPDAAQKANSIFKQALSEYELPPLDPAIKEELDAFVARRTEEGGAPTDF